MFEQTFIEPISGGKKPASILASVAVQLLSLCLLIVAPLLYTAELPGHMLKGFLVAPPVPRAASRESEQPMHRTPESRPRLLNIRQLSSRPVISRRPEVRTEAAPDVESAGIAGGSNDLAMPGVIGSTPEASAPPPAAVETKSSAKDVPVRVGGRTQEANLIRKLIPAYPPLAKAARVQGTVEFTALISKDGNIEHLQLIRGHPLLVEAAKEAVLQWKYRPTLLNGLPVEVVTDITVNFTLSQ